MAAHAEVCQVVPPWRRREVARTTGRKCEKRSYSVAYRAARRNDRKARDRAAFREALREV